MNYKLLSVALAFLYIGMVGGCSQPAPDLRYQIEVDKPLQTMEHFALPMPGACTSLACGRRRNRTR